MSVQRKLQIAKDLLSKEGNNSLSLGTAFQAVHEALGEACRNQLSAPAIKQQHGVDVRDRNVNWQNLLELMPKYCGWSERDVRYVRKMNRWRNDIAHEFTFEGTRQDVEQYLSYVENKIANIEEFFDSASETSSSSTVQYFPNNIAQGGQVTPFRFRIERSDKEVKISNYRGNRVISANPNSNYNWGCLQFVGILFAIIIVGGLLSFIPALTDIKNIIIILFPFYTIWNLLKDGRSSGSTISIALRHIYINTKSYPILNETSFMCSKQKALNFSQYTSDLYKIYFLQPKGAINLTHNLTWHEADEILRVLVKSVQMINEPRSRFTISLKEDLIFINSCKTQMLFVVEHNDRLWQSLQCRTLENNLVELTKSELEELYSQKIQVFR